MASFYGQHWSGDFVMTCWKQKNLFLAFLFLASATAFSETTDEWDRESQSEEWNQEVPDSKDLEEAPSSDKEIKKVKVKSISDLSRLAPFDDIAVIQKRFLPKTGRGEFGISLMSILNNKFFYLLGASGRLGYFIREKHGIGLLAYGLIYEAKQISSNLQKGPSKITAFNSVVPRAFCGIYYKWTPVYGKFSFLNTKIHYFDMFFDFGLGAQYIIGAVPDRVKQGVRQEGGAVLEPKRPWWPAARVSAGQVFALNKSMGFSWEFSYYFSMYQFNQNTSPWQFQHDLSVSFGFQYYFPGVGNR